MEFHQSHVTKKAQQGCENTQEKIKVKTFFSHKAYLAVILHIRLPKCLSEFQQ